MEPVSNGPVESCMQLEAPLEPLAEKVVQKKEPLKKEPLTDQLKCFLEEGGTQGGYQRLLIAFYGKKLVERAFPREWKGDLSQDQCLEILERIGHAITLDDLEEFYAELKSGVITSQILKQSTVPYIRMWQARSVSALPPYWMGRFIALFREPLKEMKIEVDYGKKKYVDHSKTLYTHYSRQLNLLQEKGDRSRPEFLYAPRELLARCVAYANPQSVFEGALIPIFNQELQRVAWYTLKGQVHKSGLDAYLFVPIEGGKTLPAQLIFRGTDSYAGVGRDLDARGIGKRVFVANIDRLKDLVKKAKTDRIEVIGHSLGAADAQRAVAFLIDPEKGERFKEISLFAFCAPRLEMETINQWKKDLKTLAEQGCHPVIRLHFAHHENDAVTWTGDSYLSGAELDFIYSSYLTVRSNSGAIRTPVHHITLFFSNGNFNFAADRRTFELRKSFPNEELVAELKKIEEIENSWQWWRGVKSYFVKVESKEEVEARIEEMKKHQAEISLMEKGGSQHSWVVYSGWSAIRYTVQPVIYYTYQGIRAFSR